MKFFDKKENSPGASNPVPNNPGNPINQQKAAPQPPQPPQQQPPPPPISQPSPPKPVVQSGLTTQTLLGAGLIIRGDIQSEESVTIEGVVEGTIVCARDVVVGSQGRLRASIRAANVAISGRVVGDVTATNKVDLSAGGQLQGNIRSPKLSIAESALFKGNIDMSAPDAPPREERKMGQTIPEPIKK
jgi:cytoskeletal protein CcmA (bactofilin family)